MKPTWAVVATMDEPAQLVAAFAAHYLSIGASEVHIFLDEPDAEAQALLAGLPQVFVTVCDKLYWKNSAIGRRPKMHFGRQSRNAQAVFLKTKADWLLHCDADEFARDGEAIVQAMEKAPEHAIYLRLTVGERVGLAGQPQTGLFDGIFRREVADFDVVGKEIYGIFYRFLRRGLTGHMAGKALTRVGSEVTVGLHSPAGGRHPHRIIEGTEILHFDGLTRLHYMLKMLRRAHEPVHSGNERHGGSRIIQFESFRESVHDAEHRETLVTMLKEITEEQAAKLESRRALSRARFDPSPALAAFGLTVDLSVEAFDAVLRRRHQQFLAEVAPELLVVD